MPLSLASSACASRLRYRFHAPQSIAFHRSAGTDCTAKAQEAAQYRVWPRATGARKGGSLSPRVSASWYQCTHP
eukprot:3941168-Rhodomonas_salina.2